MTWQPNEGATLELIGGFSPEPEYQRTATGGLYSNQVVGDVRPGTIYGASDSGQAVTVWDAQRGNYTAGLMDGIREEFWQSSWICVGAHIPSPQEPAFTRAAVTIDELYHLTDDGRFCTPQWARIEGVEHPGETQPDGTLLTPYIFPVIGGYRAECARCDTTDAHYSIATTATRPWISEATEAMPDLKLQMMTTDLRRGRVVKLQVGAHVSSYAWSVVVGLCGYSSRIVEEYVSQALAAAEGFHCWCLGGGGGVTLNARLKALHDKLAPEVQARLGLDTEQWARWAVWARNHVAHGGTRTWRPPLRDSLQLHVVAESVHLVTYLAALQEFGVPVAKVLEALLNHPRLHLLAERSSGVNNLSAEPPSGDTG